MKDLCNDLIVGPFELKGLHQLQTRKELQE